MIQITSTASLVLDLPPSCVEFWPGNPDWAVIGTYHLERKDEEEYGREGNDHEDSGQTEEKSLQQRSGSLVLVSVKGEKLDILQTLPTPFAILDVHFAPPSHDSPNLLAAATSTGSIALYEIEGTPSSMQTKYLQHIRTLQFFPSSSLITAFVWHPTIPDMLAATLSSTEVYICHINRSSSASSKEEDQYETLQVITHTLEAWTSSFTPGGAGLISGGDDSALRYISLPRNLSMHTKTEPNTDDLDADGERIGSVGHWADTKIHMAGVTAILPLTESLIVTGSYDDHIRLLQAPAVGRRRVLVEENLGGGVWRLKALKAVGSPEEGQGYAVDILASCMHAGARVLRLVRKGDEWSLEIRAQFEEHKSMNYGSDVTDKGLVVSTSFYDRLVCLWRLPD